MRDCGKFSSTQKDAPGCNLHWEISEELSETFLNFSELEVYRPDGFE